MVATIVWESRRKLRPVVQRSVQVLYENIDQILPKELNGPMHYTIVVTCVYNGHGFYTLL